MARAIGGARVNLTSPSQNVTTAGNPTMDQPEALRLRRRIVGLAQRHKRYGVGMIYLKLRHEGGEPVNYKRVERLYQEAKLQVQRGTSHG